MRISQKPVSERTRLDHSLDIGDLMVKNRVWLAPMSGVSDAVFRGIAGSFGAGLVFSEMIASREILRQSALARRQSSFAGQTGIKAVQLAGNEPDMMADAARLCEDRGADVVDINFGCPAKKVTKGYAGSALMRDEPLAAAIFRAVRRAVRIPVTVKMRLGWDDRQQNAPTIARIAEDQGLAAVTVHGRTRCQMYKGKADWRAVALVKRAISLPIIVNGDIAGKNAAETAIALSNADAVMIGRAAGGAPWLIGRIADGGDPPLLADQCNTVLRHYDGLLELYGVSMGVRWARKHITSYLSNLGIDSATRRRINGLESPRLVRQAIKECYWRQMDAV